MKNKGFSLIEMVVVVAILSIFIGMGSISFHKLAPKYNLIGAVQEIHSQMNKARYMAIFKGTKVRVKFAQNSYILEKYDRNQGKWISTQLNLLDGVIIQANNTPTFHPKGTVSNLASIHISNSWGAYKITMAISGRIKVVKLK